MTSYIVGFNRSVVVIDLIKENTLQWLCVEGDNKELYDVALLHSVKKAQGYWILNGRNPESNPIWPHRFRVILKKNNLQLLQGVARYVSRF